MILNPSTMTSLNADTLGGDESGYLPPPVLPPIGGKAYAAFEMGMAQEVQNVQRLQVGADVYKVAPLPGGPIAFDVDAPNGGMVKVLQADSLAALVAGNVRIESWPFNPGDRLIKGLTPIRRIVVLVVQGDGMRLEPRPLGNVDRGPSVWRLASTIVNWPGV